MNLDKIFSYPFLNQDQHVRCEKLRAAAKEYALILLDPDKDNAEKYAAFDEYTDLMYELIKDEETPEYNRAIEQALEAFNLATENELHIIQAIQSASMFANAAIAINE